MVSLDAPELPLFAYGSLRRGGSAFTLLSGARWFGTATIRGHLFTDGRYPAAILDPNGFDIHGDLWRPAAGAWPLLDTWEGCSPRDAEPHPYRRVRARAAAQSGPVDVWIYVWNRATADLRPLPHGNWLAFVGVAAAPHHRSAESQPVANMQQVKKASTARSLLNGARHEQL